MVGVLGCWWVVSLPLTNFSPTPAHGDVGVMASHSLTAPWRCRGRALKVGSPPASWVGSSSVG